MQPKPAGVVETPKGDPEVVDKFQEPLLAVRRHDPADKHVDHRGLNFKSIKRFKFVLHQRIDHQEEKHVASHHRGMDVKQSNVSP